MVTDIKNEYLDGQRGSVNAVVVADKNWGIGKEGRLLAFELEFFDFINTLTINGIIVMDQETYEGSLDSKQPNNRITCVISSDKSFSKEKAHDKGIFVKPDFESMIYLLDELSVKNSAADVYFIGGQSVFEQALNYCDKVFVAWIDAEYDVDAYFPNLDVDNSIFAITEDSGWLERAGVRYSLLTYSNAWCLFAERFTFDDDIEDRDPLSTMSPGGFW